MYSSWVKDVTMVINKLFELTYKKYNQGGTCRIMYIVLHLRKKGKIDVLRMHFKNNETNK